MGTRPRPRRRRRRSALDDLSHPRTRSLVALRRGGETQETIGSVLGVSKARVSQLLQMVTDRHGPAVLQPSEPLFARREVARQLGVHPDTLRSHLAQMGVAWKRGRQLRLTTSMVRRLNGRLQALRQRPCSVCGKPLYSLQPARIVCGLADCRSKQNQASRAAMLDREPAEAALSPWHRALLERLRVHTIPADEEWLSHAPAAVLGGVSSMQLSWLRLRRIVTTRPHPAKRLAGRPIHAYARSELAIVREVYQTYQNGQGV